MWQCRWPNERKVHSSLNPVTATIFPFLIAIGINPRVVSTMKWATKTRRTLPPIQEYFHSGSTEVISSVESLLSLFPLLLPLPYHQPSQELWDWSSSLPPSSWHEPLIGIVEAPINHNKRRRRDRHSPGSSSPSQFPLSLLMFAAHSVSAASVFHHPSGS